ncbi:MAG TPA: NAD(P)-dependent oxidoreductase [Candidatus Saccharimonadales bacterium]|nr:NAD(P)-dependent oxidoreductase [Candidatus Saccharimonadales bacterium]
MKKTILVIGANAALAKAVIPVLSKGNTIITAGRKNCDIVCDITRPIKIPDGIDVLINFAASFGGERDDEIVDALQTNVLGTLEICKAAKKAHVAHVVLISSIFTLLDDTSPFYSIYALTKKHADELALFYCKRNGIPLTILRPSRIYGDENTFEKNQQFLYHMVDHAQKGEDIVLYGTNDAARNYIHSSDLAEIVRRVIDRRHEGVYACTSPKNSTYSQIAHAAQRIFGRGGSVRFAADKPDIPSDTFPLDQAIYKKIAYQPTISMEAGLERIKKYREGKL